MARMFTDREFREAFLADPAVIGAREGLTPEECRAIAAMPVGDVRRAARSYTAKRAGAPPQQRSWLRRVSRRVVAWVERAPRTGRSQTR
jgi:hypothetical protein